MTRDETKQILMRIQVSFTNWKPNAPLEIVVDTWNEMLSGYNYDQVLAAVKSYVLSDTSGFAPSIGDVVNYLHKIFGDHEINPMHAWGLVQKAIRNSGYNAESEFKKLPLLIQKTIGNANQLREWALTENLNSEVVSSNFMKTYKAEAQRQKEIDKLSPELLQIMNNSKDHIELKENESLPKLTVQQERKISEENAVPMPQHLKEKIFGKE